MNHISRLIAAASVAVVFVSAIIAQAGPRSRPLDEDAALTLLERTLKHDRVYARRSPPETSPVLDRYRVYRRSGKIEWWEPIEGNWQRYDPAKIR
jgi:hypothetical protein